MGGDAGGVGIASFSNGLKYRRFSLLKPKVEVRNEVDGSRETME